LAGTDPKDPATAQADAHRTDYLKGLDSHALKGARIGVMRFNLDDYTPQTVVVFDKALAALKAQGAVLVDIDKFDMGKIPADELTVLMTELKADMAAYLAGAPPAVTVRTLADLIAFDKSQPAEMKWFGQELFERAEKTKGLSDPAYIKARAAARRLAGPEGIDRMLAKYKVIALVSPTMGPAWVIDLVNGDPAAPADTTLPAVAGYPHLTVPMGEVFGLPVGISFIGPKWSEQRLLSLGYAYEQATHAHRAPTYAANVLTRR
jgi:amidase